MKVEGGVTRVGGGGGRGRGGGGGGGRVLIEGKMTPNTQQEAMLDGIGNSRTVLNDDTPNNAMVSEEDGDLTFDVNSEELKQFILDFEEASKTLGDLPDDGRTKHSHQKQVDDESLSSLSTYESHDDTSLSSSLTSSDIHVLDDRAKLPKAAKGKSVRFLVSNLLNKNKTQQQDQLIGGSDYDVKKNVKRDKGKHAKTKEGKQRSTQAPKKETAGSSADKLRQILGAGDWENTLVNGLPNSTALIEIKAEDVTSPRESSLPRQVLQSAVKGDQQILVSDDDTIRAGSLLPLTLSMPGW